MYKNDHLANLALGREKHGGIQTSSVFWHG